MGAAAKLDINFIKPFLEGTIETLNVQCGIKIRAGRPFKVDTSNPKPLKGRRRVTKPFTADTLKEKLLAVHAKKAA